ncbi:hypothetical protein DER71_1509, partial [Halanaerobium sp. DL-01]
VLNAFIVVFRRLILVFETCKLENIICFLCYNHYKVTFLIIKLHFLNYIEDKNIIQH